MLQCIPNTVDRTELKILIMCSILSWGAVHLGFIHAKPCYRRGRTGPGSPFPWSEILRCSLHVEVSLWLVRLSGVGCLALYDRLGLI